MKRLGLAVLFVVLLGCCINSDQRQATTSSTIQVTSSTEFTPPTSMSSSSTTWAATTTTLAQCIGDEDCGLGGWCRQNICCGSYDSCGHEGECYRHGSMLEDGNKCWNGIWRVIVSTQTTSTNVEIITTTTVTIPKKANGEECFSDSECASGDCMAEACCSKGQCGYNKRCYSLGQTRIDGRICQKDGTWKKPKASSCYGDEDCITGYCRDGVCCDSNQCGSKLVGKCYNVGDTDLDNLKVCSKDEDGDIRWIEK